MWSTTAARTTRCRTRGCTRCPTGRYRCTCPGFGPQSTLFAAEQGDGYVTTAPDRDLIKLLRSHAPGKPVTAGAKACAASTAGEAEKIAFKLWPTTGLPGELSQILPTPAHFEQAVDLVRPEQVSSTIPCGPDPQRHLEAMRTFAEAGVDELYVAPIGPELPGHDHRVRAGDHPQLHLTATIHSGGIVMPQRAWSTKRERQYEHIKDSAQQRGESEDTAEQIAARTVNKERAQAGEARTSSRLSRTDMSPSRRGGLRSHTGAAGRTRDELYEEAKRKNIKGRSSMTKAQLERAVGR